MAKSEPCTKLKPVSGSTLGDSDISFYDVREEPFEVYGLYNYREEPEFKRLPDEVARQVSPGVEALSLNTAGGRVRFCTDSKYVAIHAEMPSICHFSHMPLTGTTGFDLYVDDPETGISRYFKTFIPDYDITDGYESKLEFPTAKMRFFTVCFPSYNSVNRLFIGIQREASLGGGMKYRFSLPVVYYGSSITQGGCASRPGNSYQNIISRRMGLDYTNLGFSGAGKAEDSMVSYLASLPMLAFVADYDHNAPDVEHLKNTHYKMYSTIRAAKPKVPYLMLSRCDFDCDYNENVLRRNVVFDTYRAAREAGDRQVYYIDGSSIFRGRYEELCTVDSVHPTDLGFALLADAVEAELSRALTDNYNK